MEYFGVLGDKITFSELLCDHDISERLGIWLAVSHEDKDAAFGQMVIRFILGRRVGWLPI